MNFMLGARTSRPHRPPGAKHLSVQLDYFRASRSVRTRRSRSTQREIKTKIPNLQRRGKKTCMTNATLPTRSEARVVQKLMKVLTLLAFLICVSAFEACFRSRGSSSTSALPQYTPQITSLSIRESNFASLVLAHSRDLLIT